MTDPKNEFRESATLETIKATRGLPFSLFPAERPIPYLNSSGKVGMQRIRQGVDAEGLGSFQFLFADWHKIDERDLADRLKMGERIVLCTDDGHVELTGNDDRSETYKRITQGGYFGIKQLKIPKNIDRNYPGLDIKIYLPRYQVYYDPESFDEDIEGENYLMDLKDEKGRVFELLVPAAEQFLHKIRAEIN